MALIHHNIIVQAGAAHLLAGIGIAEGVHQQVVLLRNNHEAHAVLPVTHAVVTEVLTHKVFRLRIFVCDVACRNGSLRSRLLHILGLDNIRIVLSRGRKHGNSHSSQ